MRLLYFSRDYTPHDHRFLSALAQHPDHVDKIYFLRLERGRQQIEDRPLPAGVEQVAWAGGGAPAGRQAGLKLLFDLKRVIQKVKPDLIQAGPIQRPAFLAAMAGYKSLVSMSWGYDLLIDAERSPLWRWATRFTLKHSAALVGDCDTVRRLAVKYGMPNQRIVTFPWGVDIQHFRPQTSHSESSEIFTLLSTRSWEPLYGVELIARAFVTAAKADEGLRLVMLGGGSLSGELRKIFAQGGVEERVTFPGHVGFAELPRYYRMADLYLSASHSDGSSISLLEAMACGIPVLVSDIPGNREWVNPGENGWWFPDGDARALAEGIQQAVKQWQMLPEMGCTARKVVEGRADWGKNFPQLFRAYQIALNG